MSPRLTGSPAATTCPVAYLREAPKPQSNLIKGRTGDWEIVLGLEVHAQVASNGPSCFPGPPSGFGAPSPTSQVSLVDAAMPGMLPVINRRSAWSRR